MADGVSESSPGPLRFRFGVLSEFLAVTAILLPAIGFFILWLRNVVAGYPDTVTLATLPGLGALAAIGFAAAWPMILFIPFVMSLIYEVVIRHRRKEVLDEFEGGFDRLFEELTDGGADLVERGRETGGKLEEAREQLDAARSAEADDAELKALEAGVDQSDAESTNSAKKSTRGTKRTKNTKQSRGGFFQPSSLRMRIFLGCFDRFSLIVLGPEMASFVGSVGIRPQSTLHCSVSSSCFQRSQ